MKILSKQILLTISKLFLLIIFFIIIYIIYLNLTYYRIEDNLSLETNNNQNNVLKTNTDYSAITYNIGFGAYDQNYSYFIASGKMKNGNTVKGKYSRAISKESIFKNTNGSISLIKELSPDFILLQEVDIKATRSYDINQKEIIENSLGNYGSVFALNSHSSYLLYPFNKPYGSAYAGLLTLSNCKSSSATRISYPIDTRFLHKLIYLDRCFTITRYEVSGGKELVLINSHMSVFDKDGKIREKQLRLLNETMKQEYDKGNYVIAGGDFNHTLNISDYTFSSQQLIPNWVYVITAKDIPKGMRLVNAINNTDVPTFRSSDIPYKEGVNYTSVLDGFIISDNVIATAENIDADFMYSDHNPVKLTFKLK